MSFMMRAVPVWLILLVCAVILAVSGIQGQNRTRIFSSLVIFALLFSGAALLMELITRL